ncbi:Uncharacterized membrane protein [Pseudomonas punonensis]|uniref:Uncharacterized membrane protein n=2 Tax=Phytopseudomonas punonensis TaxID=1220495 RepID=A0A1M7AN23_9GAMM|nr:Uncharacterized membrane protein [Pseudomonas punonensis]
MLSAATLVMAILFLALVIDSGRLYFEQRNLQKLADTAALESISRLASGNCSLDTALAQVYAVENAASYGFVEGAGRALSSSCVSVSIVDGLRVPVADAASGRAIRVITSSQVPASIVVRTGGLFGLTGDDSVRLQAIAVAEKDSDPLTVFSVGAQLLDLNANGLLPKLLTAAGVNVSGLTVLDSQGLANAQITPAGLLQALGVDIGINQLKALSPQGLADVVDTRLGLIGIGELVAASATAVSHDRSLATDITALSERLLGSDLRNAKINLFGTDDQPGLLNLSSGADQPLGSALDAKLNLRDVLSTGLMTAVQGRGLLVEEASLFNGSAKKSGALSIRMGVVEPPSFGIGPVGTTAYNAQIRLQVDVDSSNLPVLGSLLQFLGTSLKLPLIIDLADAKGELTDIDCSGAQPRATIDVESRIGNLCLGSMPTNTLWSTTASCTEASLENSTILRVANFDLITGKAAVPLMSTGNAPIRDVVTLAEEESTETGRNDVALGGALDTLLTKVLDLMAAGVPRSGPGGSAGFSAAQAGQIADRYITENGYDRDKIKAALVHDKLDWKRPGLAGVLTTTMPEEWYSKTPVLTCPVNKTNCRSALINSLQSPAQNGLLGSVVDGVSQLLGVIGATAQPLLVNILGPVVSLLEPLLDEVGKSVSNLLTNLGLDLGKSEIKVHSISCGIPQLIR